MAERLIINIEGNATDFNAALESAGRRLNTFNQRVTNSSRNLTNFQKQLTALSASMGAMAASNAKAAASLNRVADRANAAGTAINRTNNQIRRSASGFDAVSGSMRNIVVSLASIQTVFFASSLIFGTMLRNVIKVNAEYERNMIMLQNISGAVGQVNKEIAAQESMDFIWNKAENAPFNLESLTDSFVKMKAVGLDPTKGSMDALTNSVAAFGGSSEHLKRATIAVQQMMGKTVVSMEELRQQLGEAVPDAFTAMAVGMNLSMQEFVKNVEDGNVAAKSALDKMFAIMNMKHMGAAERMMNTWSGLTAKMETPWSKFIIRITQGENADGFFQVLKQQVIELTNFLNTPYGEQFARDVSQGFAEIVLSIAEGIKWLYEYRDTIISIAQIVAAMWGGRLVLGIIKNVTGALAGLGGMVMKTRGFLIALRGVQDGVALSTLIFGQRITTAAGAMNVFNAAGQISIKTLGMLALRFAGIIGVALAAAGAIWAVVNALQAKNAAEGRAQEIANANRNGGISKETDSEFAGRRSEIQGYANSARRLRELEAKDRKSAESARARGDEESAKAFEKRAAGFLERRKVAEERVSQWNTQLIARQNANRRLAENNFSSSYNEATTKRVNEIQDRYAAERQAIEEGNSDNKNAELNALYKRQGAEMSDYYRKRVGGLRADIAKYTKEGNLARAEAAKAELRSVRQNQDNINSGLAALNSENDFVKGGPAGGGKDKKGKGETGPKTDGLDGLRSRLVNARVEAERLQQELLGVEDFDTYDAEAEAQGMADAIKSEQVLRKNIADTRDLIRQKKIELRDQKALVELNETLVEQERDARSAFRTFVTGYESLNDRVTEYTDKLKEQYREQLNSGDMVTRSVANYRIALSSQEKLNELTSQEALRIRDKYKTLQQNFMTTREIRAQDYQQEVEYTNAILNKLDMQTEEGRAKAATLTAYLALLEREFNETNKITGALRGWALEARDWKENIGQNLSGWIDGFVNDLAQGKFAFMDFAKTIISGLAKIIIQALIAKVIMSALGLGSNSVAMTNDSMAMINSDTAGIFHSGGIVGTDSGNGSREVAASLFSFAQKYHTGGIVGLKPNEVPIIAEKGEGVFTEAQMKAMGNNKPAAPNVQVNVINQTGTQAAVEQSAPRFDGEKYVTDIILKKMNEPGPIRNALVNR